MSPKLDSGEHELGLRSALDGARVSPSVQRRIALGALDRVEARAQRSPAGRRAALVFAGAVMVAVALVSYPLTARFRWHWPEAGTVAQASDHPEVIELGPHRVTLEPGGRLRIARAAPEAVELELEAGRAHFEVAKLGAGKTFQIHAATALVEVVGTEFTVGLEAACTRVEVQRGKVRVGAGAAPVFLTPGQAGTYCPTPPATGPGEQERLIHEALGSIGDKTADLVRAEELFARYLRLYPNGVFAEEALFYECHLKGRLGHSQEAQQLAEQFLHDFPRSGRVQLVRQWLEAWRTGGAAQAPR